MSNHAKAAYEAFYKVRWPNEPIRPTWEKLSPLVRNAWEAAVKAVLGED